MNETALVASWALPALWGVNGQLSGFAVNLSRVPHQYFANPNETADIFLTIKWESTMGFVLWCYYMFMLCAFISLFLGSFFLSCFIASLSKSILPFTSFTFAVSSIFCLVFCFVLVFLMQRYHVDVKRENMIFFLICHCLCVPFSALRTPSFWLVWIPFLTTH